MTANVDEKRWNVSSEPSHVERKDSGAPRREYWDLPLEEEFLEALLRDIFENHWRGIRFGPLIQGAAYEWRCPSAPTKIGLMDGYLIIMFEGGGHFHLCIGDNKGSPTSPTSPELREHRKPSEARIFRGFGADDKPVTWGFEMSNGKSEPMISIFFANPFINDDDSLADKPKWHRLETWRTIAKAWLGREPEPLDEEGAGFRPAKKRS